MVIVQDKKYACRPCINGHRSSHCQHPYRPLFKVKRKGRPLSQCDACRQGWASRVKLRCNCTGACCSSSESATKPKPPKSRKAPETPDLPGGIRDLERSLVEPRSTSLEGSSYEPDGLSSHQPTSTSTSTHFRLSTSQLQTLGHHAHRPFFPRIPSVSSFPPLPDLLSPTPRSSILDPTNLIVYPRIVFKNEAAARAAGLIRVPRLKCCAGSCRCPIGECICDESCKGACRGCC